MASFIPAETIRCKAESLLAKAGIEKPPVPARLVARVAGVRVVYEALGTDLSGVLHIVGDVPLIAVNSTQSSVRQRFTIAHELGHYRLHGPQTFVDRQFVFRRGQKSAAGIDREEIQANMFAAELLMPRDWLAQEFEDGGLDVGDDEALNDLARRYGVSQSAMLYRLINLDLTTL